MTPYIVAYEDKAGKPLETAVALAWSHWDACEIAWHDAPLGAEDFQVYGGGEMLTMPSRTSLGGVRVLNTVGEAPRIGKGRTSRAAAGRALAAY